MKTFVPRFSSAIALFSVLLLAGQGLFAQGTEKIRLPITFDNAAVNYDLVSFGNASTSLVADPKNAANKVAAMDKPNGAETWAGTVVGNSGLAVPIQFSAGNTKFTMDVYSPIAGITVLLKVENGSNGAISVETSAKVSQANTWETLTFDFANPATGTPALDLKATYSKVVVFMNFGTTGNADGDAVYLFDKISHPATDNYTGTVTKKALPVTFDLANHDYGLLDFGGVSSKVGADPANSANKVGISTKTTAAETWGGTIVYEPSGFDTAVPFAANNAAMKVKVYSPHANIQVRLKLEVAGSPAKSVETEATVTEANKWQTLTFDFTKHAAGTPALDLTAKYNKAVIFFNFGVTGAAAGERVYYWDDLAMAGTGTATEAEELPQTIVLDQNYPNPFNPTTVIPFQLKQAGMVRLAVYDLTGREVAVLIHQAMNAGAHQVNLDAAKLNSGVYVYRLEANGNQLFRKMTLMR